MRSKDHLAVLVCGPDASSASARGLPPAAKAVYERLQVKDQGSHWYHLGSKRDVRQLGPIALRDLAASTGLCSQSVHEALDVLRLHALIHDVHAGSGRAWLVALWGPATQRISR